MRLTRVLVLVSLFLAPQLLTAQQLPDTCVEANGLTWCYNPEACGEACNDVCAVYGGTPVADSAVWFEAQNTTEECQVISQAFGLGTSVSMASYTYGCAEDTGGDHVAPGGLNSPLLCSTSNGCPDNHRTNMDQLDVACGADSRRSVCPCENVAPIAPSKPVPTLSGLPMIIIVMVLAAFGFGVLRRRKA